MKSIRSVVFLSQWPARAKVKRFLLYGALFLALLNPLPASGQDLNAWVYSERWSYWGLPQHFGFWVGNQDNVPIAVISITMKTSVDYGWIYSPPGWTAYIINDAVVWAAEPGSEIQSGQSQVFGIWGPSWNDDVLDWQVVGIWPWTEYGKATWGKTYGHSAY